MKTLKDCTALITGASSGIGEAFAYRMAAEGCNLVLTARSERRLMEITARIRRQYGVDVHFFPGDLSLPGTPEQLYATIREHGLDVDILVNNAGFGKWANFLDETTGTYEEMLNVNISAVVKLTHLFLPGMLEKGKGGIINIASTGAFQPCPYIAVYCASKAFVLSFSEALYGEYYRKGITVTAVCPGNTQTDFFNVANADTSGMSFDLPSKVADEGLRAFMRRDTYKVIGLSNYVQSLSSRFLSRKMIVGIVRNMFEKRVNAPVS